MRCIRQLRTGRRSLIRAAGLVLTVVLATGGWAVAVALASPSTPTPTITSHPTNPTTVTSATFTYTDSKAGVTFKCSLDGSGFSVCPPSGISYNAQAQGQHTFAVEAQVGSGSPGAAATYSWSIVPPTPTITLFPANPTASQSAAFNYTDSLAGVSFKCSLDGSPFATCSSSGVTYSKLADGSHTFRVEAQFGGNTPSTPANFIWSVDISAPKLILTFPASGGTYNASGWNGGCSTTGLCGTAFDSTGVQGVAVSVQQGTGSWWGGTSFNQRSEFFNTAVLGTPTARSTAWSLGMALPADGPYTVHVRSTDTLGNFTAPSAQLVASFTIKTMSGSKTFAVSGSLTQFFYPGASQPIDLSITNPNSQPITIASGGITVGISTSKTGCSASSNFAVTHSLTTSITIPANSTRRLSALGVPQAKWPLIAMLDTLSNQDACKSTSLTLTYTGTATG